MQNSTFNPATHLSIAWGVTLAVLTLIEWRSLDRNPVEQQILTPFIEREISISSNRTAAANSEAFNPDFEDGQRAQSGVQYEVEFHFNGPLFLACFFGPVLAFHGIGWLLTRARARPG